MELHLVGMEGCPYVQRVVIALMSKDADFKFTVLGPTERPDWFVRISPRGKVPLLKVDDAVLFESQAICEFVEEALEGPPLFTDDLVERALDRAWFQTFTEELFGPVFLLMSASDAAVVASAVSRIAVLFTRLEETLADRDWLSGDGTRFGMADLGAAPGLFRLAAVERLGTLALPEGLPRVRAWMERVLTDPTVDFSYPPDGDDRSYSFMAARNAACLPADHPARAAGSAPGAPRG